ncbi:ShlB/FhaC/HecB family hemolysin secretion/activation protein [Nostoc sp. 'Peltigera membranacea cyanobiont' N6]|uniref:ShlB/FhaC/HecB family hemolysin secretion/activation protein n=1 Tax=Nostoc sp. 'Peltigera membranacea cyanobiont' N6 TaxID=1261031 RepID=UPI000D0C5FA7|nr:ShlB/FhaC/HecB family hemolysin secretion/activation protein [Nostoc sp. 'Peltigera membranacea cyanobiont' N6]AVH63606.1 hemolysin activation/secretion protein [Nostoc sp. 'Peltigera membranacea cyanobiont' N6]
MEETIPKPIESPLPTPKTPETPSLPLLPIPTTPPSQETSPINERFLVNKIEILGNTILKKEISNLVQEYEQKKEVSFEDLITLRTRITALYISHGYITSGAFILNDRPNDIERGIVTIQIVEGKLEGIEIKGLQRLEDSYVRSPIKIATTTPLNKQRIEEALQLLQLDPIIKRVNAELIAGSSPGLNILRVELTEAPAFHAGIAIANNQSPSIGSVQGSVFVVHDNFTGLGDQLRLEYGLTKGLNIYNISYKLPVNPENGTLNIRYSNNNSRIIAAPFDDLGIRSDAETLSFGFRQPLIRRPQTEFAVGIGFDLRRSQTFLLDNIPFSFSEGAENGESRVSVIRFYQDWVHRSPTQVLAARSQFSFGIDAFDATVNNTGTDGRFFSWLGQFQWAQQLTKRILLLTRIDTQLTPDSLLSLEKFSIGGVDTVRGYRQNQLVSDNSILGAVELHLPISANPNNLQLTPFFEIGGGWNNRGDNPDPSFIASTGLGLEWQVFSSLNVHLDYGIPLFEVKDKGDSLQDNGFYFSLQYQPF